MVLRGKRVVKKTSVRSRVGKSTAGITNGVFGVNETGATDDGDSAEIEEETRLQGENEKGTLVTSL